MDRTHRTRDARSPLLPPGHRTPLPSPPARRALPSWLSRPARRLRCGVGALLAAGIGCLPAAGAAPPPARASAAAPAPAEPSPQVQMLDVTLVPAGSAPRPVAVPPTALPAPLSGALTGATGSSPAASPGWLGWSIVAIAAGALAGLAWRRRRRRCPGCRAAMRRLDREAAFAELDMAERTEHLVGDVVYQVWHCDACGRIEKVGTANELTGSAARSLAAPVGSAAFLRRRAQAGLSIWSPPPLLQQPLPRSTVVAAAVARPGVTRHGNEPPPPAPSEGADSAS